MKNIRKIQIDKKMFVMRCIEISNKWVTAEELYDSLYKELDSLLDIINEKTKNDVNPVFTIKNQELVAKLMDVKINDVPITKKEVSRILGIKLKTLNWYMSKETNKNNKNS